MTGREWKPGDVAMVNGYVAVRSNSDAWYRSSPRDVLLTDSEQPDARPLVVIDPEDREQAERLMLLFAHARWGSESLASLRGIVDHAQAALREFADPKPSHCTATLVIGSERLECERDADHVTDHRNDSVGQGVRWSA